MGTALTERQVRIVKKLANEIVLALDADAAGSQAMVRGHDVIRESPDEAERTVPVISWRGLVGYQESAAVNLRIAVLPEGRDPDDVIRQDEATWRRLVDEARPVLDFRLEAAAAAHDLADPRGRSQFVQEFLPLLAAVTDPVVRAHYLQRLARLSLLSEEELASMLARGTQRREAGRQPKPAAAVAAPKGDSREEFLLTLLLRYPELRAEGLEVQEDLLWESLNRQILTSWKRSGELDAVKTELPLELEPYLERLIVRKMPAFDPPQVREAFRDCILRLQRRALETEKQAVSALLATREEEVGASALMEAALSETEDSQTKELADLQLRDMETGLKLHGRERSDGQPAVQTHTDG
jgi:DNA primase